MDRWGRAVGALADVDHRHGGPRALHIRLAWPWWSRFRRTHPAPSGLIRKFARMTRGLVGNQFRRWRLADETRAHDFRLNLDYVFCMTAVQKANIARFANRKFTRQCNIVIYSDFLERDSCSSLLQEGATTAESSRQAAEGRAKLPTRALQNSRSGYFMPALTSMRRRSISFTRMSPERGSSMSQIM